MTLFKEMVESIITIINYTSPPKVGDLVVNTRLLKSMKGAPWACTQPTGTIPHEATPVDSPGTPNNG